MSVTYTARPLTDFTWLRPEADRVTSPFSSLWIDTLDQLRMELEHLGGHDVVLELDIAAHRIRRDGMPKADARVDSPAVVVSFDSDHGPMVYRADRYWGSYRRSSQPWQENVRSVVMTLNALRAVGRYGVTRGEQYAGFSALEAGPSARAMPAGMSRTEAESTIRRVVGAFDYSTGAEQIRRARVMAHPDRHRGDHTLALEVDAAAQTLGIR